MFAMRDEEAFAFCAFMFMTVVVVFMFLRHKLRTDRLRTIQKAIESGHLDEAARRSIIETLSAESRSQQQMWQALLSNGARIVRTVVFIAGWLTFVIGGVVFAGMLMFGAQRYEVQSAMIATAVGFALVTLPLAMRDFDCRRTVRG
jgi:hypothetical protein